jgi:arginine deiminase
MDKDLLGTSRFAVVRDELDQNQDRMHLDCVFSILSDNCCLMLETIMGANSPLRRLVDLWELKPDQKGRTRYELSPANTGIEFADFIRV